MSENMPVNSDNAASQQGNSDWGFQHGGTAPLVLALMPRVFFFFSELMSTLQRNTSQTAYGSNQLLLLTSLRFVLTTDLSEI